MADLSKLILPVKDTSTGEIENQEFNLSGGGGAVILEKQATLSTSNNTIVTFSNPSILATSTIDVYTTLPTLGYSDMSIADGTCTITFPKQESVSTITVKIYIK